MPVNQTSHLRLYCICGQKMKVSDDMYGRPGKCVACRQKIRIPRRDEVPPDVTELHLKDHPEFLRKSSRKPVKLPRVAERPDEREEALGKEEPVSLVPLDPLEPLRALCSLEHKLDRTLAKLDEVSAQQPGGKAAIDRAEMEGNRARVATARGELDEMLRQRLMEVAIELASTQEKIAEAGLAVRVGEIDFNEYRDTILKLRHRRDRLERRQVNLRGWLTTHDPYLAGGYVDVPMSSIPPTGYRYVLPQDSDSNFVPLDNSLDEFRDAFEQHERAERKLAEADRLETSGTAATSLVEVRAENRAIAKQANARIDFLQGRFRHMLDDFDGDVQAIHSQIDLARGRLEIGEIDRARFDRIDADLGRVRADLAKARAIVRRALNARKAREVPYATGTFIQRLARARRADGLTADVWLGGVAAIAFAATLVLPVIGQYSPLNAMRQLTTPGVEWLVIGPLAAAIVTAFLLVIPKRAARGWLIGAWWAIVVMTAAVYVRALAGSTSMLGRLWRETGFGDLGVLVFAVGLAALLVSACVALWPARNMRWTFTGLALLVCISGAAIVTNFFGAVHAEPEIGVHPNPIANDPRGRYETAVSLENTGGLPLIIEPGAIGSDASDFFVERQIGAASWQPIEQPNAVQIGRTRQSAVPGRIVVEPNRAITYFYTLEPGDYRVRLTGASNVSAVKEFSLGPPLTEPIPEPEQVENEVATTEGNAAEEVGPAATVELRGSISAGAFPQFSFRLTLPNGTTTTRRLVLQDELYNGWQIIEADPEEQTVAVQRGDTILILRKGEEVRLESPDS